LEAEQVLVGEETEEIDGGSFIKDDVDDGANEKTADAALPVRHALLLKGTADPARCHGNEETGSVERNDVVQLERDTQKHRKKDGEVVDAKPHRNGPINGKILCLVKVEEVAKAGHPVQRDSAVEMNVERCGSFVSRAIHWDILICALWGERYSA
jgi:hypothetical protein